MRARAMLPEVRHFPIRAAAARGSAGAEIARRAKIVGVRFLANRAPNPTPHRKHGFANAASAVFHYIT